MLSALAELKSKCKKYKTRALRIRLRQAQRQALHYIPAGKRRLLVDVSVIYGFDAKTGIQRVVRSVVEKLISQSNSHWIVCPVAATGKSRYRLVNWSHVGSGIPATENIEISPGDVFLGLDLSAHILPKQKEQLAEWKKQGVKIYFFIYDLLPLEHPEWFSKKLVAAFHRWIDVVAAYGDGYFCISDEVKSDLKRYFLTSYAFRLRENKTFIVPMAANATFSKKWNRIPPRFDELLNRLGNQRTYLIVGTLEPRKGHEEILDIFSTLWRRGEKYNLVFVGKQGWKTNALQKKILSHELFGEKLFWWSDADDFLLEACYGASTGVIVPSLAEGFGLPVIEALVRRKPVLARDIPIFRNFSEFGVEYFSGNDQGNVLEQVHRWIENSSEKKISSSSILTDWSASAKVIIESIA